MAHRILAAYSAVALAHLAVSLVHPFQVASEVHQLRMVEHSAFWEAHHEAQGLMEELDQSLGGVTAVLDHLLADHRQLNQNYWWQKEAPWDQIQVGRCQIQVVVTRVENVQLSLMEVAVVAAAGNLPAVAVELDITAAGCYQCVAACRERMAEIQKMVAAAVAVHQKMVSLREEEQVPEWCQR